MLISPFINFWKACLIIALCKIAAAPPHTLGFLIHPFQSSFSNAPRNCPYRGKFVNPLEPVAIISFQNSVRHKSHHSLHSTTIHFVRLASLAGLRCFPFHSVCSVFRAFSTRLKVATKASAFLPPKSLSKPLPGRHRQCSVTAKGTKRFAQFISMNKQTNDTTKRLYYEIDKK
jgi:hypothetical protein